jgi:hypothetical protein
VNTFPRSRFNSPCGEAAKKSGLNSEVGGGRKSRTERSRAGKPFAHRRSRQVVRFMRELQNHLEQTEFSALAET